MDKKAAKPKKVTHSHKLEVLHRLKRDFAVRPAGFDSERWADKRVSRGMEKSETAQSKRLIREIDHSIKGVDFPAKEMAQIIRSWMKSDED